MSPYILLLRGINVGGHNRLRMKELVAILESLGLEDVETYIQSGNAVFRARSEPSPTLDGEIARAIEERHGFRPRVLVLSLGRLERAMAENPFPEAEEEANRLHLFFLAEPPEAPDLAGLEEVKAPGERFRLGDGVLYLHAPEGIGRSKLAAKAEQLLGVEATARNWRTVETLADMAR